MKFTVKKSEWLRDEGGSFSYLLRRSDNKKCCLGFLALECGAKDDDIRSRDNPANVVNKVQFSELEVEVEFID